jgi:hypothetical protein
VSEPPAVVRSEPPQGGNSPSRGPFVEEVASSREAIGPEIEEGSVDSPGRLPGGPEFSPEEHRAKATKLLSLLLFGALVVIFVAHFVSVLWLAHNKPNSVEEVSRVFNTWIPVFAGLFGSAATFYFTQGRK